jgi:hypothetical protein
VMIDIWEERTNEQQDDVELKRDRIAIWVVKFLETYSLNYMNIIANLLNDLGDILSPARIVWIL